MNPFSHVSGLTSQQVDSIFTEYVDKGTEVWKSPKKESYDGVMKNFLTYSMHWAGVSTACFTVRLLTLIMPLKWESTVIVTEYMGLFDDGQMGNL